MAYLMSGQLSELERLRLQAQVWEPAADRLLGRLGAGEGRRAVDVGCGAMGWLRSLSRWVGPTGTVVGTDFAESMLAAAAAFIDEVGLPNVSLELDDLFDSRLAAGTFDLVHARFQLAPLGRMREQIAAYDRLLRPGGTMVLEDPDTSSWTFTPTAPAAMQLIALIGEAFRDAGGDLDAGRVGCELLVEAGYEVTLSAEAFAMEPGHPYLQLPLQFAASLRPRLLARTSEAELGELIESVRTELAAPGRRGLAYTLVQAVGAKPLQ